MTSVEEPSPEPSPEPSLEDQATAPGDVPDLPESTLRFAVAMRGGVSLAIWIGGALAEIDALRRASLPDAAPSADVATVDVPATLADRAFLRALLSATVFSRVEIDVLTGASAGGLNAALGAACIAADEPVASLRSIWMDTADIDALLDHRGSARRSVLNGDHFLTEITKRFDDRITRLQQRVRDPDQARRAQRPGVTQAFLALTVLDGIEVVNGLDPTNSDKRRSAYAHLRHEADHPSFSDFLTPGGAGRAGIVARSTASFPVAFEPVEVVPDALAGILHLPQAGEAPRRSGVSESIHLYDGGVVDNIPVARAVRAVGNAPAIGPVRRWVVFLHPSPGGLDPSSNERGGRGRLAGSPNDPVKVLRDLVSAGTELLLDDLDVLADHNRSVEVREIQSTPIVAAALADATPPATGPATYGPSDADRIYELMCSPGSTLTWLPIGTAVPEPTVSRTREADAGNFDLRMRLLADASSVEVCGPTGARPFAAVIRQCHQLIALIRWLDRNAPASRHAQRATVYDALLLARLVQASIELRVLKLTGSARLDAVRSAAASTSAFDRDAGVVSLAAHVGTSARADTAWTPWLSRLDQATDRPTLEALAAATLVPVATGAEPQRDVIGGDSTLAVLRNALDRVLRDLAATKLRSTPRHPSVPRELYEAARRAPHAAGSHIALLDVLDVALVGVHLGSTAPPGQSLNYVRVSGANASPLALPQVESWIPAFTRTGRLAAFHLDGHPDWLMSPEAKLSGNSLANFSAFLSNRFRANDWMWGRMDAATNIVDILLRREHLSNDVDTVVRAVHHALTSDGKAAELFRHHWPAVEAKVRREVTDLLGTNGGSADYVRHLLVSRRHLDLLIDGLGHLRAAELLPDHPDIRVEPEITPANVITEYETLPRQLTDIWGHRTLAVRAVQAARNLSRAVLPDSTWRRTLLAIPLMMAAAAVSLRERFLIGLNLLLIAVVLPSVDGTGRMIVTAAGLVGSFLFWTRFVRRRSRPGETAHARSLRRRASLTGIVGFVVLVGAAALFQWRQNQWFGEGLIDASAPWSDARRHLAGPLIVAAVAAAGVWLLWAWAATLFRAVTAAVVGVVFGFWTAVNLWLPPQTGRDPLESFLNIARARVWPTIALIVLTTMLVVKLRPERRGVPAVPTVGT